LGYIGSGDVVSYYQMEGRSKRYIGSLGHNPCGEIALGAPKECNITIQEYDPELTESADFTWEDSNEHSF
jgi:hypothetical protein